MPPRPTELRPYIAEDAGQACLSGGVLGIDERGFENFDNLLSAQLLSVVLNQNRACKRVGLEIVDSQHVYQFVLERLTKFFLAMDGLDFSAASARAVRA